MNVRTLPALALLVAHCVHASDPVYPAQDVFNPVTTVRMCVFLQGCSNRLFAFNYLEAKKTLSRFRSLKPTMAREDVFKAVGLPDFVDVATPEELAAADASAEPITLLYLLPAGNGWTDEVMLTLDGAGTLCEMTIRRGTTGEIETPLTPAC